MTANSLKRRSMPPVLSRRRHLLLSLSVFVLFAFYACRIRSNAILDSVRSQLAQATPSGPHHDLSDLETPFVGWPLARVCAETAWTEGLVFICDNNSGGIGNIRSAILTCLRYSIEAGATALILPRIRQRSDTDLSALWKDYQPLSYFFDEEHFRTSLTTHCPQITIYNSTYDIQGVRHPDKFEPVVPKEYGKRGGCDRRDLNRHTDLFGVRFHEWLRTTAKKFGRPPIDLMNRRVVRFNWGVQFEWPVWKDGPEFASTFGGLLKFRKDILDLGKKTAFLMREYASIHAPEGISRQGQNFMGIHLRSENDALLAWPTAENQTAAYLREASNRNFRAAYLATGNATEAEMFKAQALQQNDLHVVTKEDLLNSQPINADYAALQALSWDQRGLVDFVVLMESQFFVGMNPSSFSMSVALKRHLKLEGLYTRPWKVGGDGDGRSWLVGSYENYWEDWLFFYECIWP